MRLALALSCLLLLSIAVNAVQVVEVRSLTGPLETCVAALGSGSANRVASVRSRAPTIVGSRAPALEVKDLAGKPVTLDVARPGKTAVLYLFSPGCGWCRRNLPNMRALMTAAGRRFSFVPISLDAEGVSAYWARIGAHGVVYTEPSPATRSAYGFTGTPQTIVIGPDGKIIKDWSGAYTGQLSSEVSSALGVRLPGLSE
jgi:peroxiredoxin